MIGGNSAQSRWCSGLCHQCLPEQLWPDQLHVTLSFFLIMTDASNGFETSTGTLYVSKPYRSKTSKKLRAQITFAPRNSAFDINNENSVSNEFRVRSCIALSIECLSFSLGLFLAVLDINIYLYTSNICAKHRSKWTSTQPSFCHNVLSRPYHIGSK